MILIGSRSLVLRAPYALFRKPLDFDFICTQAEFDTWMEKESFKVKPTKVYPEGSHKMIVEGSTNCEFELVKPGTSSAMLEELVRPDCIETPFGMVPSLDMLFTIKS